MVLKNNQKTRHSGKRKSYSFFKIITTLSIFFLLSACSGDEAAETGSSSQSVPTNAPANISFTDTDLDGGQLQGQLTITKATDESDVTHYLVYWGSGAEEKLSGRSAILLFSKTGSDLIYSFRENTSIPTNATHLLAFTKNSAGEMATGASTAIEDLKVPTNTATGLSFTDSDPDAGQLEGDLTVTKANDESDLTQYVLYWGFNSTTKLSGQSAITTLDKTGGNLTHNFSANTNIPTGASHFLVFTKNDDGEMTMGVSTAIVDAGAPTNKASGITFVDADTDSGELEGTVTIGKATDESDITHYLLYWGSGIATKLSGQSAIATLAKTGSDLTHNFIANTTIPTGATHLLVFTKNANGEMASGISMAILDNPSQVERECSTAQCTGTYTGGFNIWKYENTGSSATSVTLQINGLSNNDLLVTFTNPENSDKTLPNGSGSGVSSSQYRPNLSQIGDENFYQNKIPDYVQKTRDNPPTLIPGRVSNSVYDTEPPEPNFDTVGVTTRSWKTSNNSATGYGAVSTTLRGEASLSGGKTVKVWVADNMWVTDDTDERINQAKMDVITSKFATDTNNIYSMVRDLVGDEWGTHGYSNLISPTQNEIHIVFFDIDSDGAWGALGFFWSVNNVLSSSYDFSNEALVFFMDAPTYGQKSGSTWDLRDWGPVQLVSTLAHEFQHMIHFYQKNVKLNAGASQTWLDEMSAMTVEDFISTHLGGTGSGPAAMSGDRLAQYVRAPNCSLTTWSNTTSPLVTCNVYASYATAYSFGGYLVRHYGAGTFLKNIVQSNKTSTDAIDYALSQGGYSETYKDVLRRWGASLSMDSSKAEIPTYYGYPEKIDGNYTLQQSNMHGFSSPYTPKIYTTPPSTLKANSHVVWKLAASTSGTYNRTISVPGNSSITVVVSP